MAAPARSLRFLGTAAAALVTLATPSTRAQPVAVHRVADLETSTRNLDSSAFGFVELGGIVLFSAADDLNGFELWRSDGTPGGTRMVADLYPGRVGSYPSGFIILGGDAYFTADDGVTGRELWRSDGTDAGTRLVLDLCPGPCDSRIEELAIFANRLFFGAWDGGPAAGLWTSDGTAAGTHEVKTGFRLDVPPAGFAVFAGRLYFAGDDGASGREPWTSDGTAAGTAMVADICPGCSSFPLALTPTGAQLFFTAFEPVHGRELWRTDGTAAGTRLVADLAPGSTGSDLHPILPFGDGVYTVGGQCGTGPPCAWRTDGTEAGTVPASELFPLGSHGNFILALATTGSRLFFTVWPGGDLPFEIWVVAAGSSIAQKVAGGFPEIASLTPFRGGVLFCSDAGPGASRVWVSDGTAAGTRPLTPANPSCSASPLAAFAERAYFVLFGDSGLEPWITDGTPGGTYPLGDLSPLRPTPAFIDNLVALDDRLFFSFTPNSVGGPFGLWASDGSEPGTSLAVPSAPLRIVRAGGRLFFLGAVADDVGLFSTDGTPGGTVYLSSEAVAALVPVQGVVFFTAEDPAGQRLWVSDGTAAGTRLVVEVNPGDQRPCTPENPCREAFPASLTAVGDRLFFTAFRDDSQAELWKSDGTPEGTSAVRSFAVGEGQAENESPRQLTAFPGGLLFTAFEEASGRELWRSDGTPAGTVQVGDLAPGPASSDLRQLTAVGAAGYFLTGHPGVDERLWRLAPGSFTPNVVHDFATDPGSFVVEMKAVGDLLFLVVFSPATGAEPWVSDGAPAGTGLLRDLFPGPRGSAPKSLAAVDGRLLFAATDGEHGVEPWVSDGTPAGTRLIADVYPGAAASDPEEFTAAGPWVYFLADDGESGRELWAADRAALVGDGSCAADATTLCLNGGRFRVHVDWRTPLGTAGPGRVVPFGSDDSGLFWFFNPDNWELLVKVLRGCPVNDHYWVFFAATTNVEFALTVTDTRTGAVRPYFNPIGRRADAVTDTAAFPCP